MITLARGGLKRAAAAGLKPARASRPAASPPLAWALPTASWAFGPAADRAAARRARAEARFWSSTTAPATAGPRFWPVRSTIASRSGLAVFIIINGAVALTPMTSGRATIDSQKPMVRT